MALTMHVKKKSKLKLAVEVLFESKPKKSETLLFFALCFVSWPLMVHCHILQYIRYSHCSSMRLCVPVDFTLHKRSMYTYTYNSGMRVILGIPIRFLLEFCTHVCMYVRHIS